MPGYLCKVSSNTATIQPPGNVLMLCEDSIKQFTEVTIAKHASKETAVVKKCWIIHAFRPG
jgi:hypothetical protein